MKYFLTTLILFTSLVLSAQAKNFMIRYDISFESLSDEPKAEPVLDMFWNSEMKIYIASNRVRMEYKIGTMSYTTVIVDKNKGKKLTLSESKFGKFAQIQPASINNNQNQSRELKNIRYTDEYKEILGYNCRKIISIENGQSVEYWITKEIKLDIEMDGKNNLINPNLPGFPMEFSKVSTQNVRMTFKASDVRDSFNQPIEKLFSLRPPTGYQLTNPQEK